jgi:hypothetical protein
LNTSAVAYTICPTTHRDYTIPRPMVAELIALVVAYFA